MNSWNKVEFNDIGTSSSLAKCVFTATAVLLSVSSTFSNKTAATEGLVTESSDFAENEMEKEGKIMDDGCTTTLMNWSGTHSITIPTSQLYEPETIPELEQIVHQCYLTNTPIRPIGSALSPNAIAFHHRNKNSNAAMISMVHLNQILAIDKENMTVTVQAGARVSEVRF
jgi:L-galactono-1,4-lactone dehydrogenase